MFLPLEKWLEYYVSLCLPSDSWLVPVNWCTDLSLPTSISFIFINMPKLWLSESIPREYSYLQWSNIHTDIGTLCNTVLKSPHTIHEKQCGFALKMILLFSDFECWAFSCSWQQKTPTLSNAWNLCKKIEWDGRKRARKRVPAQRAYPCLHFHPVSTGLIPYFMSPHQADSNSSRETRGKRDFDSSPPPKSLPVIVCSWVSKVNMVREVWGCRSCVFQPQGRPPSHQQIHAGILCIMPFFTHKFCSSPEKHLAQIRQFTVEFCVCVCVRVDRLSERLKI